MTYGLVVYAADGTTVTFDSRLAGVGVPAEIVSVAPGTTVTKTYPLYPGRTAKVASLAGLAGVYDGVTLWGSISIDYALGYPRVVLGSGEPGVTYTYMVMVG